MAAPKCQRGWGEDACPNPGTHALLIHGWDTGIRMGGPDARTAVLEYIAQREDSVSMVQTQQQDHVDDP